MRINSATVFRCQSAAVLAIFLGFFVTFLTACAGSPRNAQPVQNFEKDRYLGKWYEIARLDHSFERDLVKTSAEYSLREDGMIRVLNRGYNTRKNEWQDAEGKAKFAESDKTAALEVSFFGPFYGDYNVVALDSAYTYSLVTSSSLEYLWILSRTPQIPEAVKDDYVAKAQAMGFEVGNLIWVPQE